MSYRVVWTDNGLARAEEHADAIAELDPSAAGPWVEELLATVERLADHPRMAPRWPRGTDDNLRQLVFRRKWIVIYRVSDAKRRVSVLTVRHGRQRPAGHRDPA